jgi:4-phospho-D-threonate 3-dehydrogenase / 4-phospho-D-erythronate 3-dehydrogenase
MIRLAVSVGCPCGIGPEVSVAAAAKLARSVPGARAVLVGDLGALRAAARVLGLAPERLVRVTSPEQAFSIGGRRIAVLEPLGPARRLAAGDRRPGKPGAPAGRAQLAWIDAATDLVVSGGADALVTGPVSKEIIARSGAEGSRGFFGHTEHLAARLRAREVTMAFATSALTTSLVTTHLPLARVPRAITAGEVARAVYWTAEFASRLHRSPRLAVCALNPHAGEHGLLGDEETRAIGPGIERARTRVRAAGVRLAIDGPLPAETAFRLAAGGAYHAVVAMYHDQATIPMKLLGFGEAVNVSLGLPIIRTSVDHGTAYDRAGKGTADPRGMIEAMALAARLASGAQRRPKSA